MKVKFKNKLTNKKLFNKLEFNHSSSYYEYLKLSVSDVLSEHYLGKEFQVLEVDFFNTVKINDKSTAYYHIDFFDNYSRDKIIKKYGLWKMYKFEGEDLFINKLKNKFCFPSENEAYMDFKKFFNKLKSLGIHLK